ncbi:conserved hypothetical protein [Sphingomonas sp. T1]|uniref:antitoxin VbhA family protein n=1 Tax=Sphingomonas sp. T1 TaxID=2653172 RepID=UPI0012F3F71F|nr:antitoxin VbhA family protein [Sphingomonas sp. T1]VXD01535.1 conserved hypothetical protein [Sphingomonas sp. T1]
MDATAPFTSPVPAISEAERARRVGEINFTRGSLRYEGGILADDVEQLNARYIACELDSDQLTATILASA